MAVPTLITTNWVLAVANVGESFTQVVFEL
jgi:hypothetical protein